jgi:hypothetical protein
VIVAPDVEGLLISYLTPLLGGVKVASNIPNPRPVELVRVSAVPHIGFEGRALYRALVTVEAWAGSRPRAAQIAAQCCGQLDAAVAFWAAAGSTGYLPDPDTGAPRYLATVEVAVRGLVL